MNLTLLSFSYLIALAEHISTFRVTQNNKISAIILNHSRTNITSKRALLDLIAILCRDVNTLIETCTNEIDVESWW